MTSILHFVGPQSLSRGTLEDFEYLRNQALEGISSHRRFGLNDKDLLPRKALTRLVEAAAKVAPGRTAAARAKWVALLDEALAYPTRLGFVTVDGTAGLGRLVSKTDRASGSADRSLKAWEAKGLVRAFEERPPGRKGRLCGVQMPLVTDVATWLVDRNASFLLSTVQSKDGPMFPSVALTLAVNALTNWHPPPSAVTGRDAERLLKPQTAR
jgi:hypothetical protein